MQKLIKCCDSIQRWKDRVEVDNEFFFIYFGFEVFIEYIKRNILVDIRIYLQIRKEVCGGGIKLWMKYQRLFEIKKID